MLHRRRFLGLAAVAMCGSAASARAAVPLRVATTWRVGAGHQLGVLREAGGRLQVEAALPLPSRAHGVIVTAGGDLLAAGRRPGEWLLRWRSGDEQAQWCWIEPDRCFNGHLLVSPDGRRLYTTESDLATGAGLVGVRDAATLQKLAEWPTHGVDPHALVWDADGRGLLVANGGIPASPETGRLKLALDSMDSSLVRLDGHDGGLQGQWRLPDARLSLRHLVWADGDGGPVLGIALQAEHDTPEDRANAPVLARLAGGRLSACDLPAGEPLAGYGGDVCAAGGHFFVTCPRADVIGVWDLQGRWRSGARLPKACAAFTPRTGDGVVAWAAGERSMRQVPGNGTLLTAELPPLRIDNHAVALADTASRADQKSSESATLPKCDFFVASSP